MTDLLTPQPPLHERIIPLTRILRLPEVIQLTGLSRAHIYRMVSQGTFPKQVKLGDKVAGWVDVEIEAWIQERIEQRDSA